MSDSNSPSDASGRFGWVAGSYAGVVLIVTAPS